MYSNWSLRIPALGVEKVCARLDGDERFCLLTTGPSTAAARQQTLLTAMEWSHGLLDPGDQIIFRRLCRFSGSFSAPAATAVAGTEDGKSWEVDDALARLVEKSLLAFEDGEPPRYRLLETLQYYGLKKLEEAGESETIAERHRRYFLALFEPADEVWETMPDADWLRPRAPDIDNIRLSLDRSLGRPDLDQDGIALFGTSGRLWYMLDLVPEGREYGDKLGALIDDNTPAATAARALGYNGISWRDADRAKSVALKERSAALYRQIGDRLNLGSALSLLGGDLAYLGRYTEAKAVLDEARDLLASSNRLKSLWNIINELGVLAQLGNDIAEAVRCFGLGRELARTLKDVLREGIILFNLGEVEFRLGAIDRAIERARESAIREPTEQALRDRLAEIPAVNLTPDDIRVWAAEGARWSPEYAVEFTLRRIVPPAGPEP
jgi:tetratricopeptide (TPR) repeat protein